MELTLESAFSPGGLVGHLAYLLLVLSMAMRVMWLLRVLVIGSALVAIAYAIFWLHDPVGVFWESLLVLVNVVQLCITFLQNRRVRFTDEEADFVHANFPGLSNKHKRRLLDLGRWRETDVQAVLIEQGIPVGHLCFLARGEARITSNGKTVGLCGAGAFLGEMTAMTGEPASGTVILTQRSRYWSIAADDLRRLAARHEEVDQALRACFHRNVLEKLIKSNQHIEHAGGVQGLSLA